MQMPEPKPLPEMLSAITDAMLSGQNIDQVLNRYGVSRRQASAFIAIISGLHKALVGVKPSRRFAHRLKQDLMGAPRMNVISRIRYLPPRVQIAAGIALAAGFMLLARRRLQMDAALENAPEAEVSV